MTFTLRKWYLDCVAPDGEVAVAYCAELRWRSRTLRYASLLQFDDLRGTRVRSTLRGCPEPLVGGGRLVLDAPALEVSGSWEALDPPAGAELLAGCGGTASSPRPRRTPSGRFS